MPALSSDRPQSDTREDLFGHAPFARSLAYALARNHRPEGLVAALYGPWGAGKSTVLAFVQHYLSELSGEERPIVVNFNPWWFSGQDGLAMTFLGQLQAAFPDNYRSFKEIGKTLSEYSDALGTAAAWAGTATGHPWVGTITRLTEGLFKRKPKDVPALKRAVSEILNKRAQRIVVIVDDIDRLVPDEVRQLFTVIKALADFPFVTYLLAFDRDVVKGAIENQTGMPGGAYLEKIIQVPFELPPVPPATLHRALFKELDLLIEGTKAGRFDSHYWTNVFFAGLSALVRVPRDVVRLINTLSVTYPAVRDEVNVTDFIAIEAIRVFLPPVYQSIRDGKERFCGYGPIREASDKAEEQVFHEVWLSQIPEPIRTSTKEMLQRIFPRLESVWSNMHYTPESEMGWRRAYRVCAPSLFDIYFRLSLPAGVVSASDVEDMLRRACDASAFGTRMVELSQVHDESGISKARGMLERLMDYVDSGIGESAIRSIVDALLQVGDDLLRPEDGRVGSFDIGNEVRVVRLAYHLVRRLPEEQRPPLLLGAFEQGRALYCMSYLLSSLREASDGIERAQRGPVIDESVGQQLTDIWLAKIREMAATGALLRHPQAARLIRDWRAWGTEDEAVTWWRQEAATDDGLVQMICLYQWEATSYGLGDYAARRTLRLDPRSVEPYMAQDEAVPRLRRVMALGQLNPERRAAIEQYLREAELLSRGESPDLPWNLDRRGSADA